MAHRQVLIASAAIASALAVCAPAQAASQFTGNGTQTIINGSGAFSDAQLPAGSFTDIIEFDVPSAGTADVGLLYFQMMTGITDLAATFNGTPITFSNIGGTLYAGGLSKLVAVGPQTITVTGTSASGGSYSGNVKFSAAVPELASWLMMIAGVGFTGFAMRRRKTAYKVNYAF